MGERPPSARWLAPLLRGALALLALTWRVRFEGKAAFDAEMARGAVLAFWHGEQLPIVFLHRDRAICPIISWSADGELLAAIVSRLGYEPVRGSSSRGGQEAFHQCLTLLGQGRCPGVAIDGPRGPRHEPKHGALTLAARSGRPILLVVANSRRAARLRSWDRFEIPLPFTRITVRYGRMDAPPDDEAAIEHARSTLRASMEALSAPDTTPA